MGYALELTFDVETERRHLRLWEALAEAGISSTMTDMGARPHISLAVFDRVARTSLVALIAAWAGETPPFALHFGSVGAFPGSEGVVFVAPVVTLDMLVLHDRLHCLLEAAGLASWPHYRRGQWIPHCTAAINLPPDRVGPALEVCRNSDVFGPGQVVGVSVVSFRPVCEMARFPLGDNA